MPQRPETLATLKRAAASKRRTDNAYRAALLAAREAGHSFAEIARAAGLGSRQAAQQLYERLTR